MTEWNKGEEHSVRSSKDMDAQRRADDRDADSRALGAANLFGESPVDRRLTPGPRATTVTADQHYALSRRVTDLKERMEERMAALERYYHDLIRAHDELRSLLMGQVDRIAQWCKDRDKKDFDKAEQERLEEPKKEKKRRESEILSAVQTFTNVVLIVCFVIWFFSK